MLRHIESSEIILYLAEKENAKRSRVQKGKPITIHQSDVYKYGIALEKKDPSIIVVVGASSYEQFRVSFPGVTIGATIIRIKDISSPTVIKDIKRYGPTASTRDALSKIKISRKK